MASSTYGFDLSEESWEDGADYAKVWDGVFTISEPHHPGGFAGAGFVNNRGFLFEVETEDLGKHFLMSGIPSHGSIDKVKKLESDTGIPLRVVVTSGDFHHMAMKFWLDAFPTARFVHSSLKFPNTRNGSAILENEEWRKRIDLVDGSSFPMLDVYGDTVQFFGFNQCYTIGDKPFMSSDSKNPTKLSTVSYLKSVAGASAECDEKFLCIWMYHVPSKTLAVEHNFQMYIHRELKRSMPLAGKFLFPTEKLESVGNSPFPKLPATEKECAMHCQQMHACFQLDVRALMDYHCMQGKFIRQFPSKAAYQQSMKKVLHKTGEDVVDGSALMQFMNKKGFCGCF